MIKRYSSVGIGTFCLFPGITSNLLEVIDDPYVLYRFAAGKIIQFVIVFSILLYTVFYYQPLHGKIANATVDRNYSESDLPSPTGPIIVDPNLKTEVVFRGLTYPTDFAFLDSNNILVIEKDTGIVRRIVNNTMMKEPLLDVNVATFGHKGMLGIAVSSISSPHVPSPTHISPDQALTNDTNNMSVENSSVDINASKYVWLRGYPIEDTEDHVATNQTKGLLVDFNGKGKYSPPEFTWFNDVGPTAIRFFNSDKLGNSYQDDIFVGDIMNGNIYHFELNKERTELLLPFNNSLSDKVVGSNETYDEIVFGKGFGGITDIEVGPGDGYLYILTFNERQGTIYRITTNGSTLV
jgi:glucose/arabinose dehydrogenase